MHAIFIEFNWIESIQSKKFLFCFVFVFWSFGDDLASSGDLCSQQNTDAIMTPWFFFSVTSFWQKYSLGLKMSLLVLAQERFIAWKIWVQSRQPFFNQEWKRAHFTLTEQFGFIFSSLMMLKVFGMLCFFGLRARRVPRWELSGLGTKAQQTVVSGAPISGNIFFCIFCCNIWSFLWGVRVAQLFCCVDSGKYAVVLKELMCGKK